MTSSPRHDVAYAALIVGVWHLVKADGPDDGQAEMDIRPDGQIIYSIRAADRWQIMKLTYRVEGDTIVSSQPSAPREERTAYALSDDGMLILEFAGKRSWFRRGEKKAPDA